MMRDAQGPSCSGRRPLSRRNRGGMLGKDRDDRDRCVCLAVETRQKSGEGTEPRVLEYLLSKEFLFGMAMERTDNGLNEL